ncbi:6-pyruvoyl tetrahydrobiopterin synthase-like [Dysidea avara]|uniref:6-pyruvoyl tetrahydrobiopterin synthase-like n=1 Tax=Dysidea avara TaxID=196820 RepID=UPI00331B144E
MSSIARPRIVYLTRKEQFSAAHCLSSPQKTKEENAKLYGKCINEHGHNYKIEVTVKGEIDPVTGMVMNLVDLKLIIKEKVLDNLDHKFLDKDVPFFQTRVSSTENIAVYVWDQLANDPRITSSAQLHEVIVHETDKQYAVIRDE